MIPEIRNTFLRRATVIFTVASIVVCLGPIYFALTRINSILGWVEDEFNINLRAAWRGARHQRKPK